MLIASATHAQSSAAVPVFKVIPVESKIKFDVEASVAITGTFDKWDATLTFTNPDVTTGVLDIKIQADSVDTGSGMKNGKLKGKDFFDVKHNPYITFHSTKLVQTGPDSFEVDGDFTRRWLGHDPRRPGLRPQTVWNEQRNPLHKDCRPR
jgi:polyisoprenoid-binding protein YceI